MSHANTLIIGTGGIGKRHIRGFLKTGRTRVSVIEPNASRREQVRSEYEIEEALADLDAADLTRFDLGVICTPAHLHVPLARQCINAGLHVLIEKPLAITLDGIADLQAAATKKKRVVRVAYVMRAGRELMTMRQQVIEGRIGELRMCYINKSQDYPRYRPDYHDIYYAKAEQGGGAILDFASHSIDVLLWFFGEPVEVGAMYDRLQLRGVECEDACLISIRFTSGAMAQININQFQKPNTSTIEMIGTGGNLLLDAATLKFAKDDSGTWEAQNFMEGFAPMDAHEHRFRFQADRMLDAIAGLPDALTTLEEARTNLRVALAAKASYQEKRIVRLSDDPGCG